MKQYLVFLVVALVPSCAMASLYSKGDSVVQLTPSTFDKNIVNSEGVSIVEFYAPWCGHCKNLSPVYKNVAQKLKGILTVAAVDCDENANKKLCAAQGVKGYPTIKLFGPDKMKNPYTGEVYKEGSVYPGGATAKGLMDAGTALLSSAHITRASSLEEFIEFTANKPDVAKVVLFTSKKETPTMLKALSMQLHHGLDFAEVHESVEDIVLIHSVEQFPSVMVMKADGSTEFYTGDLKASQLLEFLAPFSSEPPEEPAADDKSKLKTQVARMTLTEAADLDVPEDMYLLGLYNQGGGSDCKDSLAAFSKAVLDMQEVVKVALVDVPMDKADQVLRYGASVAGLKSHPCSVQLVLLPFGTDKGDLDDYMIFKGEVEGKALQRWVTDAMPSLPAQVTVNSRQAFFTPNYASMEGDEGDSRAAALINIRSILVTNKEEAPGAFKALALNFRSAGHGLTFGWAHSSEKEIMEQLRLTKSPSLALVLIQPVPDKGDGYNQISASPYTGPMKYNAMAKWMKGVIDELDVMSGKLAGGEQGAAAELVPEVTDDSTLVQLCSGQGGICVLGIIDAANERHGQLKKALTGAASLARDQPYHFCWIDGAKFRPVASAFGLMPSDLPAVVALSGKRMRYAVLPKVSGGSEDISTFINGVLSGSVRTTMLQELPAVVESIAGDQAPVEEQDQEAVEEEFDLSDIMSEEVEGSSKEMKMREIEEQLEAEEAARAAAAKKRSKKKSKKSRKSKAAKSEL